MADRNYSTDDRMRDGYSSYRRDRWDDRYGVDYRPPFDDYRSRPVAGRYEDRRRGPGYDYWPSGWETGPGWRGSRYWDVGYGYPASGYGYDYYPGGPYPDYDRRVGGRDYGYRSTRDRDWWDRATDEVASWFGDEDAAQRREMDEHRGKGPKGYKRGDERIHGDVCDRLTDDPALDATDIEVSVNEGEVTLTGHVASRWGKRRAEDCAESVSGVRHVQNNLRVEPPTGGGPGVPAA